LQIASTQAEGFEGFGVLVKHPLPYQCLETMNEKIDVFNKKLAEVFTNNHKKA